MSDDTIEVRLKMRRKNFDALVKADEDGTKIPCLGISIYYDQTEGAPVARLIVGATPEQKEIHKEMGFEAVNIDREYIG